MGMQVIGPYGADKKVLEFALAYEGLTDSSTDALNCSRRIEVISHACGSALETSGVPFSLKSFLPLPASGAGIFGSEG